MLSDGNGVKCVVYDRPMRTGSTTMSGALYSCFDRLGWAVDDHQTGYARPHAITHALSTPSLRYAIVRGHIWLTDGDVRLLRRRCQHLIYITAAAPLWQQLWSAAKMLSHVRRNGNTTLSADGGQQALEWLREHAATYIRMYEFYPFINLTAPLGRDATGRFPDVPPSFERAHVEPPFVPDFVIRKPHLAEDALHLMRALGCDNAIGDPKNVHTVQADGGDEADDEAFERQVKENAGVGDGETYAGLMAVARRNDEGLHRIRKAMAA